MPRKAKKRSKSTKRRRTRRSDAEVQSLLNEIDASVAAGSTIKDALAKLNVSYSNYNYWRKRHGAGGGRPGKVGARRGRAGKKSVMSILAEMTKNRQEYEATQSKAAALNARYGELKKQLEKAGG